jgi:hypothetical protein
MQGTYYYVLESNKKPGVIKYYNPFLGPFPVHNILLPTIDVLHFYNSTFPKHVLSAQYDCFL